MRSQPPWYTVRREGKEMALDPFQMLAALVAACLVLAIVRLSESLNRPWRFGLRTMLIATTLVAVVLGLVVWAAR